MTNNIYNPYILTLMQHLTLNKLILFQSFFIIKDKASNLLNIQLEYQIYDKVRIKKVLYPYIV